MKTINDSHAWGIKGGGFGLYGYLPALSKWQDKPIYVESKHLASIQARPELQGYLDRIIWMPDEDSLLAECSSLVVCVPPTIQQQLVLKKLVKKYQYLIVEKPIACTPPKACEVLNYSIGCAEAVRVGYSLLSTEWAKQFVAKLSNASFEKISNNYSINWHFLAHHMKNNNFLIWKSHHHEGGGVLRFYGIHLIAILASVGNIKIISSSLHLTNHKIVVRWLAFFNIQNITIKIDINSNSMEESFFISADESSLVNQKNPFSTNIEHFAEDSRIQFLVKILGSLNESNSPYYSLYRKTVDLWNDIEKASEIIYAA